MGAPQSTAPKLLRGIYLPRLHPWELRATRTASAVRGRKKAKARLLPARRPPLGELEVQGRALNSKAALFPRFAGAKTARAKSLGARLAAGPGVILRGPLRDRH